MCNGLNSPNEIVRYYIKKVRLYTICEKCFEI